MLEQWGGKRRRYISKNGMSVIKKEQDEWVYKTVWSKDDYDEEAEKIMEAIKNAGL